MGRVAKAQEKLTDRINRYVQRWGLAPGRDEMNLWELKALWELAKQEEQDLAQEQLANAANTTSLTWLRAVIMHWHNTGDVRGPLPETEEYFIGATGPVYMHGERVALYPDGPPQVGYAARVASIQGRMAEATEAEIDEALAGGTQTATLGDCREPFSDRYDAAHPEEEHDGGLGSGDWMGPWEDRR